MLFRDRVDAGRQLAAALTEYSDRPDVIILGLPRGGVPVAAEVARRLGVPLDILLVRKLGVPGREELAMGAIASGGVRVLNDDVIGQLEIPGRIVDAVAEEEQIELLRRERLYRGHRSPSNVAGKVVILVDDGLATGSTMRAAIRSLRTRHPAAIVVAVPVGAADVCADFRRLADDIVCLQNPEPFRAVGLWYEEFGQTTDDEVRTLLAQAHPESDGPTIPG